MKKCLAIVAVCLMAAPAMAGEVSDGALTSLGLGGMEVMSDADGMQVRGLSSSASAGGGSFLILGVVFNNDDVTVSFAASDANTNRATAQNAGLNASSSATTTQGSAFNGNFDVPGFTGTFSAFAGDASNAFGGRGFASGF